MTRKTPFLLLGVLTLMACSTTARRPAQLATDDPYLWLEEVEGERALQWVRQHNDLSLPQLENDPRYKTVHSQMEKIVLAKDRIPMPGIGGEWLYNFWQDDKSVRGVWRRTSLREYLKAQPKWDVLLDYDLLGKQEGENWVSRGANCLPPAYRRCLMTLSRGGKDAAVVREFDLEKREFVKDGFVLPEAKSGVAWLDEDHLFVGTDFGPGSLTNSGYPRIVKLWKRGTPLAQAETVFEAGENDLSASAFSAFGRDGDYFFIHQSLTFFTGRDFLFHEGKLLRLPFPEDAKFRIVFQGYALASMRSDWKIGDKVFPRGALVALPLKVLQASPDEAAARVELVLAPTERQSIEGMKAGRDVLYLSLLDNVKGKILRTTRSTEGWKHEPLPLGENGDVAIVSADAYSNQAFFSFENFLVPSTLFHYNGDAAERPRVVKKLPERFDARGMTVEQREATSRDGTRVPYFVIRRKNLRSNGANPTLLYGYGGFESSMTPYYSAGQGKVWVSQGGVFVLANIRGGGEFGPAWHQAALKQNRQRAFDDFIAVAEDLIARKITSPRHLGIMGGSNGGLLVGATFVHRPELFNAVVCQVPLLDMMRLHKLLAGHSWIGEYGNPDDSEMAEVILKYSPYQNVRAGAKYPKVFFETSTKDDRVHPGHARKMVARMEEQGHPVLYFENVEGGHGAAANLQQRVKRHALEYVYLFQQLKDRR